MRKRPAKFQQHQVGKLIAIVVYFPQTLMEFQFPPLLPRQRRQTPQAQPSRVTSTGRERVSDFIAVFVAPPLLSPADLAAAVSQQEFNLNVPISTPAIFTYVMVRFRQYVAQTNATFTGCKLSFKPKYFMFNAHNHRFFKRKLIGLNNRIYSSNVQLQMCHRFL